MTVHPVLTQVAYAPVGAICFVVGLTVLAGFVVAETILQIADNRHT